jgi:large subunit ribosomal protein L15
MRVPKRGFRRQKRIEYQVVNVRSLERLFSEGEEVNPHTMFEKGLCKKGDYIKILGDGELTKKLHVKAHAFSKSAIEKIEKAGGSYEVLK